MTRPITLAEVLAELRREERSRLRTYGRLVRVGRMRQATAARRLGLLRAGILLLSGWPGVPGRRG